MSPASSAKQLESFIKSITRAYKPDGAYEPMTPIDEFVYSFLLWNTTSTKANVALRKVTSAFMNYNELRVTQSEDISDLLGVQYPELEERVQRLLAALGDVYNREHRVELDSLTDLTKRESRQYFDSITGITPFVAARMTLLVAGGHAVPVDDRMLAGMVEGGLFPDGGTCAEASASLERTVRASEGPHVYRALQSWSDDGTPPLGEGASGGSNSRKNPEKKTSRKASRSS